jgi:hypothetical protein
MGCATCHRKRTTQFNEKSPELIRQYQRKSRAKPPHKLKRNGRLKVRREADFVFRYIDLLRSRVGRVLRTIKIEKVEAFDRNSALAHAIAEVARRQGLAQAHLDAAQYELDHKIPLCEWMWSKSQTANSVLDRIANGVGNLQFLTPDEHQRKTRADWMNYNWPNAGPVYKDWSEDLMKMISANMELPKYFEPLKDRILIELQLAASTPIVLDREPS